MKKTQKDFSFETLSVPDFEILWGEWGHIELKSGVDRPYGTFCLYGGTLRAVVGPLDFWFEYIFDGNKKVASL